jgi:hypothetical protein
LGKDIFTANDQVQLSNTVGFGTGANANTYFSIYNQLLKQYQPS